MIPHQPEEKVWFIWASLKMCSNDKFGQEARVRNFHLTNYIYFIKYFILQFLIQYYSTYLKHEISNHQFVKRDYVSRLSYGYETNPQITIFIPGTFYLFVDFGIF